MNPQEDIRSFLQRLVLEPKELFDVLPFQHPGAAGQLDIADALDRFINQDQEHLQLLVEYYRLAMLPELEEQEAERLAEILQVSQSHAMLSQLICAVDQLTFENLEFYQERSLKNCYDQMSRVSEFLLEAIPAYKRVFPHAKLNIERYKGSLSGYYQLIARPTLSAHDREHMSLILEMATSDEVLCLLLQLIDAMPAQDVGLDELAKAVNRPQIPVYLPEPPVAQWSNDTSALEPRQISGERAAPDQAKRVGVANKLAPAVVVGLTVLNCVVLMSLLPDMSAGKAFKRYAYNSFFQGYQRLIQILVQPNEVSKIGTVESNVANHSLQQRALETEQLMAQSSQSQDIHSHLDDSHLSTVDRLLAPMEVELFANEFSSKQVIDPILFSTNSDPWDIDQSQVSPNVMIRERPTSTAFNPTYPTLLMDDVPGRLVSHDQVSPIERATQAYLWSPIDVAISASHSSSETVFFLPPLQRNIEAASIRKRSVDVTSIESFSKTTRRYFGAGIGSTKQSMLAFDYLATLEASDISDYPPFFFLPKNLGPSSRQDSRVELSPQTDINHESPGIIQLKQDGIKRFDQIKGLDPLKPSAASRYLYPVYTR